MVAPLALLVRFPWIVAAIWRVGTVAGVAALATIARNPRLAMVAGNLLYQKLIATARRAAQRKITKRKGM